MVHSHLGPVVWHGEPGTRYPLVLSRALHEVLVLLRPVKPPWEFLGSDRNMVTSKCIFDLDNTAKRRRSSGGQ